MADEARHDLELPGCTPEPLMAYLKALGILRLVSEQKDFKARGWWKDDVFWLRSTLDQDALVKFFLEEYKPTPIVVPWTGTDFFVVNRNGHQGPFSKTPTGSEAIAALLGTTCSRLAPYRAAIQCCLECLDGLGFASKQVFEGSKKDKNKSSYLRLLRSVASDAVVKWIDVTTVIGYEKLDFSTMLGSGGGSDGNTHFSDNFMQNLWEVLSAFDSQRKLKKNAHSNAVIERSTDLLRSALLASSTSELVEKRTSALFDSGAVGGANATQGLRRESLSNPWNVILLFEGTLSIAAALSKRSDPERLSGSSSRPERQAFPFQFDFTPSLDDRSATKESGGREIWLPMWHRPALHKEVATLFGEGRAEVSRRPARNGTEMAQAAATLGVDRGVSHFRRHAIVRGRVGGDNYNTAASLGIFDVREREHAHLLAQVNAWLDRFRRAAGDKNAPPRFASALRRIDSAIFEFCKYGGAIFFQNILVALGQAERELALTPGKVGQSKRPPAPLAGLSAEWIEAANDDSQAYAIARALAGIYCEPDRLGERPKIGPLRTNLEPVRPANEPVDWTKPCRKWAEKDRAVVWNAADLSTNLVNVLQRRMMDGNRAGCERLPLESRIAAPLDAVARFIAGDLDDDRIEQLVWGLMLINPRPSAMSRDRKGAVAEGTIQADSQHPWVLPRDYALLKLLFLPRPLLPERRIDKSGKPVIRWRMAKHRRDPANPQRKKPEPGLIIRREPRILPLLRAGGGRVGEACTIATQRLRVSGLPPMPGPVPGRPKSMLRDDVWSNAATDHRRTQRLAASLLIPISSNAVNRLVHLVCREPSEEAVESLMLATEGVSE